MGATYVVGTGGIGLFLQYLLQEQCESTLLARATSRALLEEGPLTMGGALEGERRLRVAAWEEADAFAADDTVIVATGAHDARHVLAALTTRVSDGTTVVMAQNAIGMDARARDSLPRARILRMHCWLGAHKQAPRHVNVLGIFKIDLAGPTEDAAALTRWQATFGDADILATVGHDPAHAEWTKALWSIALHGICALTDAPIGVIQTSPDMEALARALMAEAVEIAALDGIALAQDDVEDVIRWVAAAPELRNAALRDLEAGRPHDLDVFNGAVVAAARRHGRCAPVNETVLRLMNFLQASGSRVQD